jgi:hypothetical protein
MYEIIAEHKLVAVFHGGHSGIGTGMSQVVRPGSSADGHRSLDRDLQAPLRPLWSSRSGLQL